MRAAIARRAGDRVDAAPGTVMEDPPIVAGRSRPAASRPARFIAMGTNEWEGPWMNRQQILSRLARSHPVLYTTGAWSTWDLQKPTWQSAPRFGRFERKDGVLLDRSPALLLRVPGRAAL